MQKVSNMINHHHRTPIKVNEARVLVDVVEKVGGSDVNVVLKAAEVLELHRLNQHMAQVVEALVNLLSK